MPRTLKELQALGAIDAPVESTARRLCRVTLTKGVDEEQAREIISRTKGLHFVNLINNNHTIIYSAKPKSIKPRPTRRWKVGKTLCSYSIPPHERVQRARERAKDHERQLDEHLRSYSELFIAKEINPP